MFARLFFQQINDAIRKNHRFGLRQPDKFNPQLSFMADGLHGPLDLGHG